MMEMTREMVLAVIPVVLLHIGLLIVSLKDLVSREKFRGLPKIGWIVVIVVINVFGPILYLALGRDRDNS